MRTPEFEVPPSTGLVGGKYQLVKLIGRGGMGSVWEARHVSLGTPSAIKFIEAEYADSQEARSRFDKEAKAAATIQSKHAIQIYDHGVTDDGKPYIVMELLTGEPLDKRIERLRTLTLQDTARILLQVSRGLSRAHERGIVHRDLKPENIFIVRNTDDDEEVAKVLDFGIAKVQSSPHSPGITSSTKTGAVLGTPFYMSPEQARGLRNVDHRTDVWSLGVIAFKCVTGKLPFDGESVGDLLVKICTSPVPIPSHVVPGLPQAFDTWFLRALERQPERRFSTVMELAEHLSYAAGVTGRATPPGGARGGAASGDTSVASSATPGSLTPLYAPQTNGSGGYGSRTPHPAAMTAAPFTSSQPAPGAGFSKWKWIAGSAAVGLALAAVGTGIVTTVKRKDAQAASGVGLGVTQAPAPSDKPSPTANGSLAGSAVSVTPIQPKPAATPSAEPVLAAPAPVAAGKLTTIGVIGTRPGSSKLPLPPPLPPPTATHAPTVDPVTAQPTVTVTPTPPKKPNKNDPGY
jgi:serine/threonine-protein kinase